MGRTRMIWAVIISALLLIGSAGPGYSSDLVVDTRFTVDKEGKPDWVLLDTRSGEEYKAGHIPGAISLGKMAAKALRDPTHRAYTIVPAIEKMLGEAGINSDTHVIVYGKAIDAYYNTVPFWILEYLGCNSPNLGCTVHYYDGGIERWEAENGKIETMESKRPPAVFKSKVVATRLATTDEVLSVVGGKQKNTALIDSRTDAEYEGSDIRALRGGHIPGAVPLKVQKNYNGESYRILPLSQLASLYANVPKASRVIPYCQTGTRSTYVYLVLRMLGYENVGNYDDSWRVYGSNVNYPVENEQWFDFLDVQLTMKAIKELQQSQHK